MADDVLIQPASGVGAVPVAADEIGAKKHQRVKVQHGADGSATDVSAASPLPSGGYLWTGSAWVPAPGDATDGAKVNSELPPAAALADGTANPSAPAVDSHLGLYNGTTWDRQRGNTPLTTLLASASRTGLQASAAQVNYNGRGLFLRLNVTTLTSGTLDVIIRTAASGYTVASFAGLAGSTNLEVYPGIVEVGTGVFRSSSRVIPRDWAVAIAPSDAATAYTVEVVGCVIV